MFLECNYSKNERWVCVSCMCRFECFIYTFINKWIISTMSAKSGLNSSFSFAKWDSFRQPGQPSSNDSADKNKMIWSTISYETITSLAPHVSKQTLLPGCRFDIQHDAGSSALPIVDSDMRNHFLVFKNRECQSACPCRTEDLCEKLISLDCLCKTSS